MSKSKHLTGKELQDITDLSILTFQEYVDFLDLAALDFFGTRNKMLNSIIQYFEQEIANMNGTDNALRWYLTKDRAIKFLEFEKNNK